MSDATSLPPMLPLQPPQSLALPSNHVLFSNFRSSNFVSDLYACLRTKPNIIAANLKSFTSMSQQGSVGVDMTSSVSIDLKPISSERQFDRVIAEAQRDGEAVVVLWMANWCRKCIYLKPKLEKLAASYHPRGGTKGGSSGPLILVAGRPGNCQVFCKVKFYCIDVNNVPYQLVVRAGVTKMPTIQLWKDGEKQAEVIGGHKAYLVANEVREMIDDEGQL